MRGEERRQQAMLMVIDAERRVPKEHPLRRIKQLAEAALAELYRYSIRCTARWTAIDPARAVAQEFAVDGVVHGAQ